MVAPCCSLAFVAHDTTDYAAELDWENIRKQPAPKFVPVKPNTAEEDAVDWELTSLTGHSHGHVFGDISAGHSAGHANSTHSQDSGADNGANAFMAAVAMHAITTAENQAHGDRE